MDQSVELVSDEDKMKYNVKDGQVPTSQDNNRMVSMSKKVSWDFKMNSNKQNYCQNLFYYNFHFFVYIHV